MDGTPDGSMSQVSVLQDVLSKGDVQGLVPNLLDFPAKAISQKLSLLDAGLVGTEAMANVLLGGRYKDCGFW